MGNQLHRTCIRMGAKEYALLKKKCKAANLSANVWLMAQLDSNRPILFREEATLALGRFMNEVGREINAVAKDFNSGYGTLEQRVRHKAVSFRLCWQISS